MPRCAAVSGNGRYLLHETSGSPGKKKPPAGWSPFARHAGQVVRRVLLRRNIVIDAETAHLVVAAA
jgi:hypothetical protein